MTTVMRRAAGEFPVLAKLVGRNKRSALRRLAVNPMNTCA
jgi:hypothetical protein